MRPGPRPPRTSPGGRRSTAGTGPASAGRSRWADRPSRTGCPSRRSLVPLCTYRVGPPHATPPTAARIARRSPGLSKPRVASATCVVDVEDLLLPGRPVPFDRQVGQVSVRSPRVIGARGRVGSSGMAGSWCSGSSYRSEALAQGECDPGLE